MAAPAGLCEFCAGALEWTFFEGEMWTSCPWCYDIFEARPLGPVPAVGESCDEAVRRDEDLPF